MRVIRAVLFCDRSRDGAISAPPTSSVFDAISFATGVVVDTNGDGVLAGFDSSADAINAGLQLARMAVPFKVGVAFGEVTVDGDDWFGLTVVEAARLHTLAEPGQVLVSSRARDCIATGESDVFEPFGERQLKGLPEPDLVMAAIAPPLFDASSTEVHLAIDLVGSTALMARAGDAVLVRLQRLLEEIVAAATDEFGGEQLDQRGDGFSLAFPSVSSACDAGSRIANGVSLEALRADTDSEFRVRAAIDLEARTAEALLADTPPGELHVSARARRLSRDAGINFSHLGEQAANEWRVDTGTIMFPLPRSLNLPANTLIVGRESELSTLEKSWDRALAGQATVVQLSGEPGMGKTHLISAFTRKAAFAGAMVLYGECDPELDIPYGPIASALAAASSADHAAAEAIGSGQELFAEQSEDETAPGAQREVVFRRVAEAFSRLATLRPVVLVIDDLHWANTSTVQLLRHLLDTDDLGRVLVIGTFRSGEIGRGHPLRSLDTDHLRTTRGLVTIGLNPFETADITALIEQRLGGRADDSVQALSARLQRETSGNSFFTNELLRQLIENQSIEIADGIIGTRDDVQTLPIPDTVRGVVARRLDQLGEDTHRVLSVGSVAGRQFSLDVVAEALSMSFASVVDLIESAEKSALVAESDQPRSYAFVHAIVRSTLLDDLSATRLAAHHEAIGEALERLPGDNIDALTHHWTSAAGPTADAKALTYLRTAAERDAALLAWEAAIERYRLMLSRLQADQSSSNELLAEVWLGLGGSLRALGDVDYLDAMIEAGRHARSEGRADLLARAATGAMKPGSWFANANETNDTIIGFCEDALVGLPAEDPMRVNVLSILATSLAFEDDRARRVELVFEAVSLARSFDDTTLLASALIAEHLALWDPTTLERRREIADELGVIARRRDLPEVEFLAGFFAASALLETCQVDECRRRLETLVPMIERTGNFWFHFLVERMRIGLDIAQDVPNSAVSVDELFEASAATQADAGGTWAAQHGGLAIHEGRFGDMADSLKNAAAGRQGQGIWPYALAIALIERGQLDEATEVADGFKRPSLDFMWLVSMQMLAEVGRGLDRKDLCIEALDALLPFRDRLGVIASGTLTYGLVSTSIGEAALGTGDIDLAVIVLERAVADAQRVKSPFFETKSQRLLDEAIALQLEQ